MDAGPAVQDLGPISPELVLVDPALAERARRLLPDPTESLEPRAPAAIESRPSVPAPVRPEVAPMPVPRRRRRWARTVVLAVVVFAAGAASGGFLPDRHSAPSDVVLEVQSAGPAGTQGEESGPPQRPPAAKRSAQRHSAAKRSPQRPSAAKRSPQRPPRARPVPPHRTWAANVLAAAAVTALVLAGSFHRVEIVLLVLSSVFVTYIASGILAHPRWGQAARGLVVPDLPLRRHAILVATATLGTTLAPWGLAFIQSYAVDKKLKPSDWRFERIDVVAGAVSTGVIGFFIVVACAETLYRSHTHINDASDAAVALTPLAGHLASTPFAAGLLGAGLLAAAILPLSTSYSVSEAFGKEGGIAGNLRTEPVFFSTYIAMPALAAASVLGPRAPLVPILFLTQAVNAVMLLPLLAMIAHLTRDRALMGELRIGTISACAAWATTALITVTVIALGAFSLLPSH